MLNSVVILHIYFDSESSLIFKKRIYRLLVCLLSSQENEFIAVCPRRILKDVCFMNSVK